MGRPLKIQKTATNGQAKTGGTYSIGVNGGDTGLAGAQIQIRVKVGSNAEADGYIIRQKGSAKFLVSDGTNEGVCTLSDLNDASLTADTMTITVNDASSTATRLARISNKFGIDFSDNRVALSFSDEVDATEIKSGTNAVTIDVVRVENDELG